MFDLGTLLFLLDVIAVALAVVAAALSHSLPTPQHGLRVCAGGLIALAISGAMSRYGLTRDTGWAILSNTLYLGWVVSLPLSLAFSGGSKARWRGPVVVAGCVALGYAALLMSGHRDGGRWLLIGATALGILAGASHLRRLPRGERRLGRHFVAFGLAVLAISVIVRVYTLLGASTSIIPPVAMPGPPWLVAYLLATLLGVLILGLGLLVLAGEGVRTHLADLAHRDPLTGLLSRRGFEHQTAPLLALAARHGRPLTLLVLDLDHFKRINDSWGHAAGDAVLRHAAALMRAALRESDLAVRLGGEEMAILLADTGLLEGTQVAERLRHRLETTPILIDGRALTATASIGVASVATGVLGLEDAMRVADAALYRAKAYGRNRVETTTTG